MEVWMQRCFFDAAWLSVVSASILIALVRSAGAADPAPAPPATTPAAPANLVGIWNARVNEFQKEEAGFLPDGRYYAVSDIVGVLSRTTGRYTVKEGLITFAVKNGPIWS